MMSNENTKEGTRVRVTVYGVERTGTVETVRNVAWVRMDDNNRLRWFHWESLSPECICDPSESLPLIDCPSHGHPDHLNEIGD